MTKVRKLTRAELNEIAWQKKKKKKHTHGNKSGSRANSDKLEHQSQLARNTEQPKQPRVVRAIPLNIPGRATPLVAPQLADTLNNPEPTTQENKQDKIIEQAVDLVIRNGKLVSAQEIEQEHKRAQRAARRAAQKAKATKSVTKRSITEQSITEQPVRATKLGKAALRRLEREELDFLETKPKAKKDTNQIQATGKIYNRDYKAGRNTDYQKTQAQAEKSLRELRKSKTGKKQLTSEELLSAWENMSW